MENTDGRETSNRLTLTTYSTDEITLSARSASHSRLIRITIPGVSGWSPGITDTGEDQPMSWQQSIQAAVRALKQEEQALQKQLDSVQSKINELEDIGRANRGAGGVVRRKATRRLSQAGRDAISKAAKKRWAKYRSEKTRGARQSRRA